MAQIQYPAYTQPPAFTPPATAQLGWRAFEPDNVVQAPRGRYPTGKLITALQTVGAVVFAVEQFALPKPLKAEAFYPSPPNVGLAWTAQAGGKGVSRYTALWAPFLAYDFDPENWALPKPMAASAELPDKPYQFIKRTLQHRYPSFFPDPAQLTVDATGSDWMTAWPAQTGAKRPRAAILTDVDPLSPETFPPTLEWSALYPDTTSRERLTTAEYPSLFRPEALGEFDATLLWSAVYPDRTTRAALQTAELPYGCRPDAIQQFAATLLWNAFAPDTTRRASLRTAAIPSVFAGESIEHFTRTLLATTTYPDTTRRSSLAMADMPSDFWNTIFVEPSTRLLFEVVYPDSTRRQALVTAQLPAFTSGIALDLSVSQLLWNVIYPDTTRRADSARVVMPASFRGEAIEQFQGLRWSVLYPDRTIRLFLAASDMPSAVMGIDISALGLDIVDRRHDDQTDRAGSRSVTVRMSGF